MAFVPQSIEALDPLQRVGKQIEGMARGMSKRAARERRRALFARYRLDETAARKYPFELSGGMARRVLMAAALMQEPRLIVADEPTPGLEAMTARHVIRHLKEMAQDGAAVLLITHDLELAIEMVDRILVFYDGTILEEVKPENFREGRNLKEPYTQALYRALPEHEFFGGE